MLIAVFLRMQMLQSFSDSIYSDFLIWDEELFHQWAKAIVAGEAFNLPDLSPLPAYLMAAIYKFTSVNPDNIRIFNIIIGTLTCIPVYLIGIKLASKKVGLISALLTACYKPFIFYSITLQKEVVGIFLFACLVSFLLSDQRRINFLIIGCLFALLINVRQNAIVLLPLILLFFVFNKNIIKEKILSVLFFFLGFLPILFIFPSVPLGGFNLYFSYNSENPLPYYRPVSFVSSIPAEQTPHFRIEASRQSKKKLSAKEASDYWKTKTLQTIKDKPAYFLKKIFQRGVAFLNRHQEEDNYSIGFISQFIPFLKFPFPNIWPVFPLGLAGLLLYGWRPRSALKVLLIAAAYSSTLLLFYFNIRIRLFLLVILIPFAIIGLSNFIDTLRLKQKKAQIRYLAVFMALFLIGFIPVKGSNNIAAHYNTHAYVLLKKSLKTTARKFWEQSSELNQPYSAYANLMLADYYIYRKKSDTALEYLSKIDQHSFAAAYKYEKEGDVMMLKDKPLEAINLYNKALSVNSALIPVYKKLIKIYSKTEPQKIRKTIDELQKITSFYQATRFN